MKKENGNYKLIGSLVAGIVIGSTTIVCANQAIQAIQNDQIKVSLNGQVQEFKDETTGETQYPITYNNRTYLPLRNVAQLAGLNVDYDNNTNTAILGDNLSNESKEIYDYLFVKNESRFNKGFYNPIDDSKIDFSNTLKPTYYYHDKKISAFQLSKEEDGYQVLKLSDIGAVDYAIVDGIDGNVISFRAIYYGAEHFNPEQRQYLVYDFFDASSMIALTEDNKVFLYTNRTISDNGNSIIHFEQLDINDKILSIGISYTGGQPIFVCTIENNNQSENKLYAEIDTLNKTIIKKNT